MALVFRAASRSDRPLLSSLPLGTVFHLGAQEKETWIICAIEQANARYACCLETGRLREVANLTDNVSRIYTKVTVE